MRMRPCYIVFNLVSWLSLHSECKIGSSKKYTLSLRDSSLLTWLGSDCTNPLPEAGVFTAQCMIHLSRNYYFNFCRFGDPDALISVHDYGIVWPKEDRFQQSRKMLWKQVQKFLLLDFLSHPVACSSPKLNIITTICAPNLIAIGKIRRKSSGMIEGFAFQFPRISQVLALFFIPSEGHTFSFRGKNRPGNIQFTRRQRRWFHWQYNNMLHGA